MCVEDTFSQIGSQIQSGALTMLRSLKNMLTLSPNRNTANIKLYTNVGRVAKL